MEKRSSFHFILLFGLAIALFNYSCNKPSNALATNNVNQNIAQLKAAIDSIQKVSIEDHPSKFTTYFDKAQVLFMVIPDSSEVKKESRFILCNKLESMGIYDEAIKQTHKLIDERESRIFDEPISYELQLYGRLAGFFNNSNQIDSGLYYHKKAIEISKLHPQILRVTSPINNYGMDLLKAQKYDSAYFYFSLIDSILKAKEPLNEYWKGFHYSVKDNIGTYYEKVNQFEKASVLYDSNYQFYAISDQAYRKINAGISWANSLIEINQLAKSNQILSEVEKLQTNFTYPNPIPNQIYLLETKSKYFLNTNNLTQAIIYSDSAHFMIQKSSTEREETRIKYSIYLGKYAAERAHQQLIAEKQSRLQEEENNQLQTWVSILVGLGVISIFMAIGARLRNEKRLETQKSKQLIQEKKLTDLELEFKKKDLVDMTLNITQKQEWAKGIQDQLKLIQSSKGNKRSSEFKRLNEQVRNQILMEKELNVFNENIDTLNAEYYLKLKQQFPDLTKSETQLCSFIKLNLTNAQVCQLKNIDPKSAIMMRYRLKKKLNIPKDGDLDFFVKSL